MIVSSLRAAFIGVFAMLPRRLIATGRAKRRILFKTRRLPTASGLAATLILGVVSRGCFEPPAVTVEDLSTFNEFEFRRSGPYSSDCGSSGSVVSARITRRDDGGFDVSMTTLRAEAQAVECREGQCPSPDQVRIDVPPGVHCYCVAATEFSRALTSEEAARMLSLFHSVDFWAPSQPGCLFGAFRGSCPTNWLTWDGLLANDWPCHLGDMPVVKPQQSDEIAVFLDGLSAQ